MTVQKTFIELDAGTDMALPRRRLLTFAKTLAVGSFLAGCTTDGPAGSPTPAPAETPTPSATPPETDSPSPTDAASPTSSNPSTPPTGDAIQWTTRIGQPIRQGPAVHDGIGYIGGGTNDRATSDEDYHRPDTSENVTAVALDDGTIEWEYAAPAGIMERPIATTAGLFVVIGWTAGVHGVAQRLIRFGSKGTLHWTSESIDSFLSPLTIADGTVYLGTSDDAYGYEGEQLWALQTDSGAERWTIEAGDTRTATVHGGTLYTIEGGRRTTAFATVDGTERWHRSMPPGGDGIRVYGDSLYLRSQTQNANGNYPIVAVAASDGRERWRFSVQVDEPFVPTGVVADDDTVYLTEYDGWVFAVNAADGTERWRYSVTGDTRDSPVLADGTLYVPAMDGRIHAIDAATGEQRWSWMVNEFPRITDLTAAGLFVHSGGKRSRESLQLYGHDGTERWSFTHNGELTAPAVTGTRALVGTADGFLVALDES